MTSAPFAAIIDIGSNSVRLVVYGGPRRAPAVLFNEKVLAGLGNGLAEGSALSDTAMAKALVALRRYHSLITHMAVVDVLTVATAAVREASNARHFLAEIARIGLEVEVLSGDQEACGAGYGVLSAIPDADGIVGDLGGGSLELVRVRGGEVHERSSLPLGVLRSRQIIAAGPDALARHIDVLLNAAGWDKIATKLPLYLVGGSWRTLARFHMRMRDYPMAVLHHYQMPVAACADILQTLACYGPQQVKAMTAISASRLPMLGDAAALLAAVAFRLQASELIVSAHGLREGLMYQWLSPTEKRLSPLLEAARSEGTRHSRFAEHGDVLNNWIAPLFGEENAAAAELRHAACLLADASWSANPDFRAERGMDIALHGNWIGITARSRALVAQALFAGAGGGPAAPDILARLASPDELQQAVRWGLAIRLGQRLSGGLAVPLQRTHLSIDARSVILTVPQSATELLGDVVERRLKNLAAAFGCTHKIKAKQGADDL